MWPCPLSAQQHRPVTGVLYKLTSLQRTRRRPILLRRAILLFKILNLLRLSDATRCSHVESNLPLLRGYQFTTLMHPADDHCDF